MCGKRQAPPPAERFKAATAPNLAAALAAAPGVKLVDDPARNLYPMPLTASGRYDVEVVKASRH